MCSSDLVLTAERVQQIATRASLVAQQRIAVEEERQRTDVETQVQQTHAKSGEVEPEMRRKNPYLGRRKRREAAASDEPKTEQPPAPPVTLETHELDITV